ncbi:hypothetical protein [Nocardioides sp. LML1-1-1.1]|uniref:hypothetical protein n=1 Tax=Nocardioides sp. LML1-1-1.1 TaxID=3135248 RepID=UPI003421F54C
MRGAWYVDETHLTVLSHLPERVRLALCEWIEFHGGNPAEIPMCSTIRRLVDQCAVEVTVMVRNDDGRVVLEDGGPATRTVLLQGETPPLPWPAILTPATVPPPPARRPPLPDPVVPTT